MTDRKKLETAIEREVFNLVRMIKEHTRDHTVLTVRRSGQNVDPESMARVLDIVDGAIMDGFQRNVDHFMRGLDKSLSSFTDEENPLPSTEE